MPPRVAQAAYGTIWENDEHDENFRPGGDGESVAMVADRTRSLFKVCGSPRGALGPGPAALSGERACAESVHVQRG